MAFHTIKNALALCHQPNRSLTGFPHMPVASSSWRSQRMWPLRALRLRAHFAGGSFNTLAVSDVEAQRALRRTVDASQLHCVDPVRTGVHETVDDLESKS